MWIIPIIIILGMIGGQTGFGKIWRRYGVPLSAGTFLALRKKGKEKWKAVIYGWLLVALSLGYGQSSTLSEICGGKDWLVRIVYGVIVSIPFLFFGVWYAPIVLSGAYLIRAKGFKITDKIDFLWEDFIRFSCIGGLTYISII